MIYPKMKNTTIFLCLYIYIVWGKFAIIKPIASTTVVGLEHYSKT